MHKSAVLLQQEEHKASDERIKLFSFVHRCTSLLCWLNVNIICTFLRNTKLTLIFLNNYCLCCPSYRCFWGFVSLDCSEQDQKGSTISLSKWICCFLLSYYHLSVPSKTVTNHHYNNDSYGCFLICHPYGKCLVRFRQLNYLVRERSWFVLQNNYFIKVVEPSSSWLKEELLGWG